MAPQPAFMLDISDEWDQKLAAIRCYESQFITGRPTDAARVHRRAPRRSRLLGQNDRHALRRTVHLPRADWDEHDGGIDLNARDVTDARSHGIS